MGLSSNQARFLSLTSRQVDMEQRIQQICQRRLRLSSELENVATQYNNKISNRKMFTASKTSQGINTLSIANLAALGYKVLGLNTDKVAQRPAVPTSGATVINSQDQFLQIVSNLNAGNNLGDSYVLNCDIDLSGTTLTNSLITQNFTGVFDGNGHTINNLNITASSGNNIGLFSQNSGTIKNIDLENVNINAVSSDRVGAIVGLNLGTVSNVYSSGNVNGFVAAGGIAGMNNSGGLIEYSSSATNVSVVKGTGGGLVGENNASTISNCSATGNVACSSTAFGYNVGGFAGVNVIGGTIQNSYSTGDVTGASTGYQTTGAFVGSNYDAGTKILNCYTTGDVSNSIGSGGFAGQDYNSGAIQYCYASGGTVSGTYSGGFVGSVGSGTTLDNTNFYKNNMSTDNTGTGTSNVLNANVTAPNLTGWSNSIWDKSTDLPTLKNAGYTAYADDLETGLRNGTYSLAKAADEFTQDPISINGNKYQEIDWRQTPEIYDELYKGDDVDAENKYDKIISEINAQDKKLQLEQTSVEVEYKAVTSERESVKKILDTNAQSSFKYFS